MLWVPVSFVASLLIASIIAVTVSPPKLGQLVWGELPPYFLGVFFVFVGFIAVRLYLARPQYFYDEKGIYRRSQLLADWRAIATLKMSSRPGRGEPPAPPLLNLFPKDPAQNEEFYPQESVDTSKFFFSLFNQKGNEVARIPTKPSSFSISGVSEDLIVTARRAGSNLAIS